ncbi:hypothetical protein AB6D11_02940 [Vibrio splendidus]
MLDNTRIEANIGEPHYALADLVRLANHFFSYRWISPAEGYRDTVYHMANENFFHDIMGVKVNSDKEILTGEGTSNGAMSLHSLFEYKHPGAPMMHSINYGSHLSKNRVHYDDAFDEGIERRYHSIIAAAFFNGELSEDIMPTILGVFFWRARIFQVLEISHFQNVEIAINYFNETKNHSKSIHSTLFWKNHFKGKLTFETFLEAFHEFEIPVDYLDWNIKEIRDYLRKTDHRYATLHKEEFDQLDGKWEQESLLFNDDVRQVPMIVINELKEYGRPEGWMFLKEDEEMRHALNNARSHSELEWICRNHRPAPADTFIYNEHGRLLFDYSKPEGLMEQLNKSKRRIIDLMRDGYVKDEDFLNAGIPSLKDEVDVLKTDLHETLKRNMEQAEVLGKKMGVDPYAPSDLEGTLEYVLGYNDKDDEVWDAPQYLLDVPPASNEDDFTETLELEELNKVNEHIPGIPVENTDKAHYEYTEEEEESLQPAESVDFDTLSVERPIYRAPYWHPFKEEWIFSELSDRYDFTDAGLDFISEEEKSLHYLYFNKKDFKPEENPFKDDDDFSHRNFVPHYVQELPRPPEVMSHTKGLERIVYDRYGNPWMKGHYVVKQDPEGNIPLQTQIGELAEYMPHEEKIELLNSGNTDLLVKWAKGIYYSKFDPKPYVGWSGNDLVSANDIIEHDKAEVPIDIAKKVAQIDDSFIEELEDDPTRQYRNAISTRQIPEQFGTVRVERILDMQTDLEKERENATSLKTEGTDGISYSNKAGKPDAPGTEGPQSREKPHYSDDNPMPSSNNPSLNNPSLNNPSLNKHVDDMTPEEIKANQEALDREDAIDSDERTPTASKGYSSAQKSPPESPEESDEPAKRQPAMNVQQNGFGAFWGLVGAAGTGVSNLLRRNKIAPSDLGEPKAAAQIVKSMAQSNLDTIQKMTEPGLSMDEFNALSNTVDMRNNAINEQSEQLKSTLGDKDYKSFNRDMSEIMQKNNAELKDGMSKLLNSDDPNKSDKKSQLSELLERFEKAITDFFKNLFSRNSATPTP